MMTTKTPADTTSVYLTESQLDHVTELLRVSIVAIFETITTLERRNPGAAYIEVLRKQAEDAQDIRELIERR